MSRSSVEGRKRGVKNTWRKEKRKPRKSSEKGMMGETCKGAVSKGGVKLEGGKPKATGKTKQIKK